MRKILYCFILIILFIPIFVNADTIHNIDMKIYINKDGSANVNEIWDVEADGGTEWYKAMYNLGNMDLSNFSVTMDGNILTYVNDWDTSLGISEKANTYGINYTSEGMELCFGKKDYRRHTFNLSYNLSNFVFNTDDNQVVYNTLMPSISLDKFSVEVSSSYNFSDTLDVWGYGYKGYAYVENGIIKMSNEGILNNDYIVLLVKFPKGTFDTDNRYSQFEDFDSVYDTAEEGTYEYDYSEKRSFLDVFVGFISSILPILFCGFIFVFAAISANKNKYGYRGNKVINKKDVNMFRDIPCNKDIYYANVLIELNQFDYKESNILGAIILKWVREDKVAFTTTKTGLFKKDTSVIDMTRNPSFDNELEKKLFDIMYSASRDGYLEPDELAKWCKNNYSKFFNVFKQISTNEKDRLRTSGDITIRQNKEECKYKNVLSDRIYDDSVKLYGLKKYLIEFSNMKEKEVMDVKLWDEYLMFAYLFGIADKVLKQLKDLYPEVIQEFENNGFDYNTLILVNHISNSSYTSANSARRAAESYSAGGGGFSSGGGGMGSFGGGGSAGGR